jgi:hypothetical protein
MAADWVNVFTSSQPTPVDRPGPVELWHRSRPGLWPDDRCRHSGLCVGLLRKTIREQLRDWYRDARDKSGAKRGRKRRSLEVTLCFAPLLGWVVAWTASTCHQLALAMDASTLGQRFTILSISVVVRGCAIPVAWRVVEARGPAPGAPIGKPSLAT